ncbi:MAG: DUF4330 domain-containing protein [Clostridia bacterium]|nr:DUF4330 domain-containing protein [Clostridia bacterium]
MAEKKIRWTIIDTLIVIAVIAAGVFAFKMFGGRVSAGEKTTIDMKILIANQTPEVGEAIAADIGGMVTLSLTEKDSGTVKDVDVKPAEVLVYNATEGEYRNRYADRNVDIYATVTVDVEETEYEFLTGSTKLRVGEPIPFRGKGYVSEGFIISINKEGDANE